MKQHWSYSGFTHFIKQIKRRKSKHLDHSGFFLIFIFTCYLYAMYKWLKRTHRLPESAVGTGVTGDCETPSFSLGFEQKSSGRVMSALRKAGAFIPPFTFVIFFFKIENRYFSHTLHPDQFLLPPLLPVFPLFPTLRSTLPLFSVNEKKQALRIWPNKIQ